MVSPLLVLVFVCNNKCCILDSIIQSIFKIDVIATQLIIEKHYKHDLVYSNHCTSNLYFPSMKRTGIDRQ
jgi:hypothetical protein